MTVVDLVRARILALSPVTALVSTRVYALSFGQKPELGAVRVQEISDTEDFHMRGPSGLSVSRVQVDCIATTKAAAEAIEAAIKGDGLGSSASGLSGWVGSIGSPSTQVDAVFPAGRRESYTAEELRLYMISRDYLVHWRS